MLPRIKGEKRAKAKPGFSGNAGNGRKERKATQNWESWDSGPCSGGVNEG